jgi:hypothetical protein
VALVCSDQPVFGKDIASFADSLALQMPSDTMANVARFIVQPIKLVMLNPLPGGIVAGLLWPLIFLEILLVIFLLILAVAAQVRPTTPL